MECFLKFNSTLKLLCLESTCEFIDCSFKRRLQHPAWHNTQHQHAMLRKKAFSLTTVASVCRIMSPFTQKKFIKKSLINKTTLKNECAMIFVIYTVFGQVKRGKLKLALKKSHLSTSFCHHTFILKELWSGSCDHKCAHLYSPNTCTT